MRPDSAEADRQWLVVEDGFAPARANMYETRLEGALFRATAMPDGTVRDE